MTAESDLTDDIAAFTAEVKRIQDVLDTHKPEDTPPVVLSQAQLDILIDDVDACVIQLKDISRRTYRIYTTGQVAATHGPILTTATDSLTKARIDAKKIKNEFDKLSSICKSIPKQPLPRPIFDSEYENWQSFKDRFDSAFDRDPTLTPANKLEHLQCCMKKDSEAHHLISHFSIEDNNYKLAYDALKSRFERKREIVFSHLDKLMDLPILSNQGGLQHMIDCVNQTLLKIQAMKIPVGEWDPVTTYIVIQRLDFSSRREVEKQFNDNVHILSACMNV